MKTQLRLSATAFLWGFLFAVFIRSLLNVFYPFINSEVSPTTFLYLSSTLLLIFFWNAYHHSDKRSYRITTAVILLTGLIDAILILVSSESIYSSPILQSYLFLILVMLFAHTLPRHMRGQIEILAGLFSGVLLSSLFNIPVYALFIISFAVLYLPNETLPVFSGTIKLSSHRLISLRQFTDFLRIFFIGAAFQNTLTENRSFFFTALGIVLSAHVIQFALNIFRHTREHVRTGIYFLGILFILSAGTFQFAPFPVWAAISYALLSLWESIYFKKSTEGYLHREQIIAGIVLFLLIILSVFQYEWEILFTVFIVPGAIVLIAIVTYKKNRPVLALLFSLSFILFSFSLINKYRAIESLVIFEPTQEKRVKAISIEDLAFILQFSPVRQNILPAEFYEKSDRIQARVSYFSPNSLFLVRSLKNSSEKLNTIYQIPEGSPYSSDSGKSVLLKISKESPSLVVVPFNNEFSGDIPKTDPLLYEFALEVARHYKQLKMYSNALSILQELETIYPEDETVLMEKSSTAGALGDLTTQISALEKLISTVPGKNLEEKRLLLDLYRVTGNTENVQDLSLRLIHEDYESRFDYLRMYYESLLVSSTPEEWQKLYYRVKATAAPENSIAKERLISDIEERIKENPPLYRLFAEELNRQEHIIFPEN